MGNILRFFLWIIIIVLIIAGVVTWFSNQTSNSYGSGVRSSLRDERVMDWINDPSKNPEWAVKAEERCPDAPFQMPTSGFIGYLWDDSFRPGHRHQGIDIFGGGEPGDTPVYAATDGYLTRRLDWKSSLIIRLSEDPLKHGRQIWTYYTHMADPYGASLIDDSFPPGTEEMFVTAGTLLGHQGNYSGTPGQPVGVHLHFSVVRDDGNGSFLNELDINNTFDPSPYLGMNLNAHTNTDEIPVCPSSPAGGES